MTKRWWFRDNTDGYIFNNLTHAALVEVIEIYGDDKSEWGLEPMKETTEM